MLPITRRQDLYDFVDEVMSHTYERLLRGERFDVGQAMLKSYLVESHPGREANVEDRAGRLEFLTAGIEHFGGQVEETEDARLFLFDIPQPDDEPLSFVVDMADDRYWTVHTAAVTAAADRSIERLVSERPLFDSAWFPGQFLTDFTELGQLYKVSVSFEDQQLQSAVPEGRHQFGIVLDEEGRAGYFPAGTPLAEGAVPPLDRDGQSVALSLRDPTRLREGLDELDHTQYLRNAINVTRAEVKYRWDGEDDAFSNARIYSWGKITGSGSSAGAHLDLLRRLLHQYRIRIEYIENRLQLGASGGRAQGQPVNLRYQRVRDFEAFVFNLFSGTKPFRLAGVPQFRRRDYAVVAALDQHANQPLRFEVTPEYMTVALRRGACGNSIARLFTNVLQHLDASAELFGGEGDARLF